MSRLFISHSSKNNDWAIALKDWLVREGWSGAEDIFLDLDPDRGIAAGQRWVHALEDANTRCEAILFLVSEDWLASKWCGDEYQLAKELNKKLFALLIDDLPLDRLPGGLTAKWQIVRLKGEPAERFVTVHPLTQHQSPVHIAKAGLASLKRGLDKAGIGADTFELQRDQNGPFGWRAPYRGLEALEPEDAAVFFGRSADIVRGIDMLRGLAARKPPRLLVILGASGAGKSSFLRAGLWPRLLRDDSQWLPLRAIRSSRGPVEGSEGLLAAIGDVYRRFGLQSTRAALRDRLATPDSFVATLQELRYAAAKRALIAEPPFPFPVLCLDQGEEVFSASATPESEKFLALARAAIDRDAALLLVTIRSDSYGAMQGAKILAGIDQMPLSLGPVPHGEIARVIREPAEILRSRAGPAAPLFDAAVIARLQNEVEGEADALPLLAFVLQRLMREHQGLPTIGINELEHTGGVAAAIESAADAALDDAGISRDRTIQRDALRRLFIPRLARINRDSKAPQRRVARQTDLPPDLLSLARALTQRRLLVVKAAAPVGAQGDAGAAARAGATLEVAHEALLRRWPTLADLLADDRDALLLLDGVLSAAADWDKAERERKPDFLTHRGSRLSDAEALATRGPDWAREVAPAGNYLTACEARETAEREAKEAALKREQGQVARTKKLQKLASWALGAVFVVVVVTLAGALSESYQASKREAAVFASGAQVAFDRAGLCDRALRWAVAGLPPGRGASPLSFRSRELQDQLSEFGSGHDCYFRLAFTGHTNWIFSAAFSPDGARVVTASYDKTARLWDAKTGALLAIFSGHTDGVTSAAFSPDGTRVVTGSWDHTARLWDAKTGAQLAILSGHTGLLTSAAFSPDGRRIVTASADKTARLWDAKTGAVLATLSGHTEMVNSAAFSPDGTRIVTASDDFTARLWDTKTDALLVTLSGHTDKVNSAAFSPDGTRIVTASADKTARLWDAKTGALLVTLSGHTDKVNSAAFSPDGTRIVTASADKTARLWDVKTGAQLAILSGHTGVVVTATFSPDGTRVVTGSVDKTARLWDAQAGGLLANLSHPDVVNSAAFSPDGTVVVTASDDKTARLWDARIGAPLAILSGHTDQLNSAAFSPDGTRVVTASDDKTARLWDAKTGAPIATLRGHTAQVTSATFSPGGTRVVTASLDRTARLWDVKTGALLVILSGHTDGVISAAFSPKGRRIVTASRDGTARLWDAKTGAPLATLSGHTDWVFSAAFSPDGRRIVTASADKTARVWNAKTGAPLATLQGHTDQVKSAAFSPNGTRVVTASDDKTARLWDAKTGAPLAILSGHTSVVSSAAFSPDGTRVLTASNGIDNHARLWNAKTGAPLAILSGHTDRINSAAFSPDGRRVVTASDDFTARLWDVKTGALLATLWGHTDKTITAAFSADGTRIVTASRDNTARIWQIDPLVLMPADQRQDYICRERLIGAQSFTDEEMEDPILRGREDLRNPCDRVGPLSLAYYWRAAASLVASIRAAFALTN